MKADESESQGRERLRLELAREYAASAAGVSLLTLACWQLTAVTGYAAISLIFLLGVVLA